MKKNVFAAALVTAALAAGLAGCAAPDASSLSCAGSASFPAGRAALEAGAWPESEYARAVPRPADGEVTGGWLDAAQGYCCVFISDITQEGFERYLDTLEEAGFVQAAAVSEVVSGQGYVSDGLLFTGETACVSVAHIPGQLGLYICPAP